MSLSNAMRGINGEFEVSRVIGAAGGVAFIIGANAFTAWRMAIGHDFDLIAYCTAFPAGLAAVLAAIAGAAGYKDQKVAAAKIIEKTGAVPVAPPVGPDVPVNPA